MKGPLQQLCVHVHLTQVTFASDDRVAVRTMELGHILCVLLQDVHLHGSALGEAGVADVALVGFLPCKHECVHFVLCSRQSITTGGDKADAGLCSITAPRVQSVYRSASSCVSSACTCLCWRSCRGCTGRAARQCGIGCGASVCSPAQKQKKHQRLFLLHRSPNGQQLTSTLA